MIASNRRTQGTGRRLVSVLLGAGLALVMSACSSGGSTAGSGTSESTSAGAPSETAEAPASGTAGDSSAPATPSTGETPGKLTPVKMALAPSLASLPEYVALKKGFFEKQGLDVTIQSSADITNLPAALGKQFDFGVGLQNVLISAVANGLPLVAAGGGQVESPKAPNSAMIVNGDSGIKNASDLKGKRVGVATVNGSMALEALWWLHKSGVEPSDVHLVQVAFANMADQLKAKRVDAVMPLVPFVQSVLASVPGSVNLGDPGLSVGKDGITQGSFLMADKSWAKNNADTVCSVEKAAVEAIDFIKSNPDETREILAGYSGISMDVLKDLNLGEFRAYETAEDLEQWLEVMKTVGGFTGNVNVADMVVPSCTAG